MSKRLHTRLIQATIVGMFVGILGMIQPLTLALFKPGFQVLLYSTLAYIGISHITPKEEAPT